MQARAAHSTDDIVAAFAIEGGPARGRLARLGPAIDQILRRHAYPDAVARLLGEACVLASLIGASAKVAGRLIVQAQGNGPISYLVADYETGGQLRGYCRVDGERLDKLAEQRPSIRALLGEGLMVVTFDPAGQERSQGVTPLEGETLAACAEAWFLRSEQAPTRVALAVGQADVGQGLRWRAGGLLLQRLAGDETRGDTGEAWTRAVAHVETLGDDELIDPSLPPETLLWRLFNEDGVRMFTPVPVSGFCRCSEEGVIGMLRTFPERERAEMLDDSGMIRVTCEYCAKVYAVSPGALAEDSSDAAA